MKSLSLTLHTTLAGARIFLPLPEALFCGCIQGQDKGWAEGVAALDTVVSCMVGGHHKTIGGERICVERWTMGGCMGVNIVLGGKIRRRGAKSGDLGGFVLVGGLGIEDLC